MLPAANNSTSTRSSSATPPQGAKHEGRRTQCQGSLSTMCSRDEDITARSAVTWSMRDEHERTSTLLQPSLRGCWSERCTTEDLKRKHVVAVRIGVDS
jgi:hypothetical protein